MNSDDGSVADATEYTMVDAGLTHLEILKSIEHLTNAHKSLDGIRVHMNDHVYEWFSLTELCRDAWNACNKCRVHTEKCFSIEERLYPIMGLIIDGREMFMSLWGYGYGMTAPAERSIVTTLRIAQMGLGEIIGELQSYLSIETCDIPADLDEETALFIAGCLGG